MATHSSILACRIPWMEELGAGYYPWGRKESGTTERLHFHFRFLVAQMVKNLPEMQKTQVQSLGQADPLEKGMAIHSGILGWRIPWTEEPGWLQAHAVTKGQTGLSD